MRRIPQDSVTGAWKTILWRLLKYIAMTSAKALLREYRIYICKGIAKDAEADDRGSLSED